MPSSPTEPVLGESILVGWITPSTTVKEQNELTFNRKIQATTRKETPNSHPTQIIEAQGWRVDADGNLMLVAQADPSQSLDKKLADFLITSCPAN